MDSKDEVRQDLLKYGNLLTQKGLVVAAGGNISARCGNLMYIKPSGFAFDELSAEDYVGCDIATGQAVDGNRKPSCEYLAHLACYRRRNDVGAVVHAHPPMALAVVNAGEQIRPLTPDFVAYLGRVEHLPFIVPGGPELAEAVGEKVARASAIVMQNHGAITVGRNLREAYYRMLVLEDAAKSIVASYAIRPPRFLTDQEVDAISNMEAEAYRMKLLANRVAQ
jgi:L-fuculose-phosphate aldolase